MKTAILIATSLLLVSCASDKTSQNLYSSKDIGHAIIIKACTVISSRTVIIRDDHSGDQGESLGFFAGSVSNNSDRPLSGFITGIIGGAIGRHVSDKLHERDGVEYTVILRSGEERQLVQDIAEGETILVSGDPCRIQISGVNNRVLSTKTYPNNVKRPQRVRFNDE